MYTRRSHAVACYFRLEPTRAVTVPVASPCGRRCLHVRHRRTAETIGRGITAGAIGQAAVQIQLELPYAPVRRPPHPKIAGKLNGQCSSRMRHVVIEKYEPIVVYCYGGGTRSSTGITSPKSCRPAITADCAAIDRHDQTFTGPRVYLVNLGSHAYGPVRRQPRPGAGDEGGLAGGIACEEPIA